MRKAIVVLLALALFLTATVGAFAAEPKKTVQTKYGKITVISGDPRIIIAPDPIRDGFSLYTSLPQYSKSFLGNPFRKTGDGRGSFERSH